MAKHNDFGQYGEDKAAAYMMAQGYTIRDRNWHCGHKEIDLVAQKDDELVIVEVKTRYNDNFGNPEESVDDKKIRRLVSAAEAYVRMYRLDLSVRFDIITITGVGSNATVEHIPDAFFPPMNGPYYGY